MSKTNGENIVPREAGKTGMLAFTLIWIGQMLSLLGTSMTGFALTIWAWELTGQATALALVGFFSFPPTWSSWIKGAPSFMASSGSKTGGRISYSTLMSSKAS